MTYMKPSGTLYEDSIVRSTADGGARVYVIDDEREVRRSLHFLLSTAGWLSWPFASASDFLENLAALEPAPVLLDIRMPGMDGVQLMRILRERGITWPLIVMTAHGEIPLAVQTIKLGAIEFLEKPFEFEALEYCLHAAFTQIGASNESIAVHNTACRLFELLSPRESEVVKLLMQGIPNKTAAHLLSLSVRTVEMHRANALAKLDVKSIVEVAHLASDAGFSSTSAGKEIDDAIE